MKASTRRAMRLQIERLLTVEKIGYRSAAGMLRQHVKTLLAKRAGDTRGSQQ